ncbi:MAG: hypothetical protein KAU62_04880 [Candidatus Heimdallarchaeota archaeon]|nr:hypothetical protein [Candidatus Heimdallarchaeota archaeon]MCG3255401.1 hypothetical protein [Candidatus Heimdallarchaeota archaeon]MCK4610473.1 hypothetical protein [Candidatus Heimdallarchaeota archaeon]
MSSHSPEFLEDKEKIRQAMKLERYICPHREINYPCVICKDCRDMDLKQFPLKNGFIEKTRNSSLISLIFELRDPFDDMLLKRLSVALYEATGIVQKEPEPGFSITFYISEALLDKITEIEKLIDFIADFQHKFLSETIAARSALNKWERSTTKRLLWDMSIQ